MTEAVRFFWLRGEASLPLDRIPEGDRSPLRVRRSVVQAHAPDVLRQLEAGRFIATAWPSGEQIAMILCHPNHAKALADAFLVNTPALPRVVLHLRDWAEAPEVARLLLAAFGSEVADAEECLAARRQLVEWLERNGPPEMAMTVRHFFNFPFGFRADALDIVNVWRQVLVRGQKEQLDRFMVEVERRFEALGWSREVTLEARFNSNPHQINHLYCWVSGQGALPRVLLCLNRATDRRVRGGTYDLLDGRPSLVDLAREIQRILAEVIEPAAAEVGLEVSYPRLGPISRVSAKTLAVLTALAEEADGRWPLPGDLEPAWRDFIFTAVRDGVAIHPEELTEWLLASGWSKEDAAVIANRFYTDAARAGEYEEAGRQPA
jgi:hypothetical protein